MNIYFDNYFLRFVVISQYTSSLTYIVSFLDKKMEENKVEDQLENKYMGIFFVELLAEEMGGQYYNRC